VSERISEKRARGYCAQCSCYCPTVASVCDGEFIRVQPDDEHPFACGVCPKGLAGPELVYSKQRLKYPMRRTRPKGDADPDWQRISWDDALNTIAEKLNNVKSRYGAEAVAFTRAGHSSSPISETDHWIRRLANAFGTPNSIATTHICQWHRDNCSGYTFGRPGSTGSQGRAEFERAGSILIWGNNTPITRPSLYALIKRGLKQGAKLVVVDPRRTEIASKADVWLQICPGTDGALALGMINIMIEENLFDYGFVRDWTTAPLLVRSDTGDLLNAGDLVGNGESSNYVLVDNATKKIAVYVPGTLPPLEPTLDVTVTLKLGGGQEVECKTVFQILRELVSHYPPKKVEQLTHVPENKIREATRILARNRPASLYSWNGIEQSTNASQTNRAICILYALTGDYDAPGGNVIYPTLPLNSVDGHEFLAPQVANRILGFEKRPLGPQSTTRGTQTSEVYEAILNGKPYPVLGLLSFGGNSVMSNGPSRLAKEAICKLDFHAHVELFMTPTAALADIVLPASSCWECWHVGISANSVKEKAYIQLRPAVVAPRHESWPDIEIVFELANRLRLGDKFWHGDVEAAFDYMLSPSGITVEQLRQNPNGIPIHMPMEYRKYSKTDASGKFVGFPTHTKRVEIYSQTFKDKGYKPLPIYEESIFRKFEKANLAERYPLILTSAKVQEYCQGQHRSLPSLRRSVPHPFLEINKQNAKELSITDGNWILLETPHGSITLKAKVDDGIPYNVVCTQNGWWQECQALNLPEYDPYSSEGANMSLLFVADEVDPVSGSVPMRGYPCNVRKLTRE